MPRQWINEGEHDWEPLLGEPPSCQLSVHPSGDYVALQASVWPDTTTERAAVWDTETKKSSGTRGMPTPWHGCQEETPSSSCARTIAARCVPGPRWSSLGHARSSRPLGGSPTLRPHRMRNSQAEWNGALLAREW